jgi:hypothetical protein
MRAEQKSKQYVRSPVSGIAAGLGIEDMEIGDSVTLNGVFDSSHPMAKAARAAAYTRLFILGFDYTEKGFVITRLKYTKAYKDKAAFASGAQNKNWGE